MPGAFRLHAASDDAEPLASCLSTWQTPVLQSDLRNASFGTLEPRTRVISAESEFFGRTCDVLLCASDCMGADHVADAKSDALGLFLAKSA